MLLLAIILLLFDRVNNTTEEQIEAMGIRLPPSAVSRDAAGRLLT